MINPNLLYGKSLNPWCQSRGFTQRCIMRSLSHTDYSTKKHFFVGGTRGVLCLVALLPGGKNAWNESLRDSPRAPGKAGRHDYRWDCVKLNASFTRLCGDKKLPGSCLRSFACLVWKKKPFFVGGTRGVLCLVASLPGGTSTAWFRYFVINGIMTGGWSNVTQLAVCSFSLGILRG